MRHEEITSYHKHDCHFTGKLLLMEFQDDWERDPMHGESGAGTIFKYSEKAIQFAKENFNVEKVLLAIPDVVCRIV